ncbi:large subunit ribosomal protein LP [Nematocida displodere]|uniref:Large ribosomal subunit protein uL10 n=1 Tax=Nematocida displodere TaxID=1805483 RepID=A0A177EHV5_9MICR|nr:large subunit ribosomal protein LP [Nematocida displodere]
MLQMETQVMNANIKKQRKEQSFERTVDYFSQYKKFLVVDLTSISSRQIQLIRQDIRGKGDFLMGKNTTIKLALKRYIEEHPELRGVEEVIKNNVALIFTNGSLNELEDIFENRKVFSVAKPGNTSQCDHWIEPVFTGLDPGKTSFFQALGIVTKITKGKIEILSRCQALTKGKKVGHSEAALLTLLGITPFVYKMQIVHAFADGKFFDVNYLSITEACVEKMVQDTIASLSAMALGAGYVTESTVDQELMEAIKEALSLAAGAEFDVKDV